MFIVDFFKHNPLALAILGGGTSTAILTYLLNTIKWIPNTIFSSILAYITTKIRLTDGVAFLGEDVVDKVKELENMIRGFKNKVIDNSLNLDAEEGSYTKLTPGMYYVFKTVFTYRIILVISVDIVENKADGYKALLHRYDLKVIGFDRHRQAFIDDLESRFVNKDRDDSLEHLKNKTIMVSADMNGGRGANIFTINKRDLSTVYMDDYIKNTIAEHINNFIHNKHIYDMYKITYKTGIILHGAPGTGKTSLVRALASSTDSILINVTPDVSMKTLRETISGIRRTDFINKTGIKWEIINKAINFKNAPIIMLFEELDKFFLSSSNKNKKANKPKEIDYDTVSVTTEEFEEKSGVDSIVNGMDNDTLDGMLQFFDGIASPENVIFIATTNYIERLDPALTRPGRFDLSVEMKRLDIEHAAKMINDMIPGKTTEDYKEFIENDTINSSSLFTKLVSDKIKMEVFNK